jgi:hypothetical protein
MISRAQGRFPDALLKSKRGAAILKRHPFSVNSVISDESYFFPSVGATPSSFFSLLIFFAFLALFQPLFFRLALVNIDLRSRAIFG